MASQLDSWARERDAASRAKRATGAGVTAAAAATAAATHATEDTPDGLRERGNEAFKTGDFARAEELYSASVGKRETVEALANRALARIKLGRLKDAETDCSRVLLLQPNHVKALIRRGNARSLMGAHHAALEDFRKAEELEPNNALLRKDRERAEAVVEALAAAGPRKPAAQSAAATATTASKKPVNAVKPVEEVASPSSASATATTTTTPPLTSSAAGKKPTPAVDEETLAAAISAVDRALRLPPSPPTTNYAFVKLWRDLRDKPDMRRELLADVMGPHTASVAACFAKTLEPELFLELVRELKSCPPNQAEGAALFLQTLVKQPPFQLTRHFLTKEDWEEVRSVARDVGLGGDFCP